MDSLVNAFHVPLIHIHIHLEYYEGTVVEWQAQATEKKNGKMRAFRIADRRKINLMAFSIFYTSFFFCSGFFSFSSYSALQRISMHIQSMAEFALRSIFSRC